VVKVFIQLLFNLLDQVLGVEKVSTAVLPLQVELYIRALIVQHVALL
jgi:hypothetical protein